MELVNLPTRRSQNTIEGDLHQYPDGHYIIEIVNREPVKCLGIKNESYCAMLRIDLPVDVEMSTQNKAILRAMSWQIASAIESARNQGYKQAQADLGFWISGATLP